MIDNMSFFGTILKAFSEIVFTLYTLPEHQFTIIKDLASEMYNFQLTERK